MPEGIAQLWNASVSGSNLTNASGLWLDSLYQTISLTISKIDVSKKYFDIAQYTKKNYILN